MFNHLLFVNTFAARSLPLTPCRLSFWRINWENKTCLCLPVLSGQLQLSPEPGRGLQEGQEHGTQPLAFQMGLSAQGLQSSLTKQDRDRHHCPSLGRQRMCSHGNGTGDAPGSAGQREEQWGAESGGCITSRQRQETGGEEKAQLSEHTWVNQGARAGRSRAPDPSSCCFTPLCAPIPLMSCAEHREIKPLKSMQVWNSPICLPEQQLSHKSKHPKLLNVQLQFLALASALVTLLQFLPKPWMHGLYLCRFSPVSGICAPLSALPPSCMLADITLHCYRNYFEVISKQDFSSLFHALQLERNQTQLSSVLQGSAMRVRKT